MQLYAIQCLAQNNYNFIMEAKNNQKCDVWQKQISTVLAKYQQSF